ncbi:MAG: alpha/beta hydrolase [Acidimicrobiales bacterium]
MGDDSGRDLHLPARADPVAAAVVLHPHPAMGGDRHHPLVVALAAGLAEAGVAALRPDLTDPSFPAGAEALAAIALDLRAEVGVDRLFLVGYSWGSVVTALAAVDDVAARVLVAPPVTHVELAPRSEPTLVLVPAHDQYGPPDAARAAFAPWPDATVEVVDGCDHFVAGAIGRITERSVAWLVDT